MDERTRKWYSAYVADLRDTADRDYLVARISSRLSLYQSSAWSGLQAIEKYFNPHFLFDFGIPTLQRPSASWQGLNPYE